jgi:putative flippase GtrA
MAHLLTILRSGSDRATGHRLEALAGTLVQLSRYSAASMLALALDFAVYLLLTAGDMQPVLAGVLGYGAGLALHFLLSIRFVFAAAATRKAQGRLFGEFALSGLAGIATTAIVMVLATGVVGLPGLPAKALAACTSFLLVYWLRRTIVFAPSPTRPSAS